MNAPENSKAVYKGDKVPSKEIRRAIKQWTPRWFARIPMILIGIPLIAVQLWLGRYVNKTQNVFGEGPEKYLHKHLVEGASPVGWFMRGFKDDWMWYWDNDEDGLIGDIRGAWSEKRKGREDSKLSMFLWSAIRNPCNNFSRYTEYMACMVNECDIEYWGDYETPDDRPLEEGWHFVKATNRNTGKVYYGFRKVKKHGQKKWTQKILGFFAHNYSMGFKIKPSHADNVQRPDNAHKGYTWRASPWKLKEDEYKQDTDKV